MKHIVYISGPMSDMPENNYPAFHEAAEHLRRMGYNVINPAVTGTLDTMHLAEPDWFDYMASAIIRMRKATAFCQLPGHAESFGARIEAIVADYKKLKRIEL